MAADNARQITAVLVKISAPSLRFVIATGHLQAERASCDRKLQLYFRLSPIADLRIFGFYGRRAEGVRSHPLCARFHYAFSLDTSCPTFLEILLFFSLVLTSRWSIKRERERDVVVLSRVVQGVVRGRGSSVRQLSPILNHCRAMFWVFPNTGEHPVLSCSRRSADYVLLITSHLHREREMQFFLAPALSGRWTVCGLLCGPWVSIFACCVVSRSNIGRREVDAEIRERLRYEVILMVVEDRSCWFGDRNSGIKRFYSTLSCVIMETGGEGFCRVFLLLFRGMELFCRR